MLLDPEHALHKQLLSYTKIPLEGLVAGTCASIGYTVFRDLKLDEDGATVGQADVLASMFLPLREQRILIECKGTSPSFSEIQEFSTWRYLFQPPPDELVLISRGGLDEGLVNVARQLNVSLVQSRNLRHYILPLLDVPGLREERARQLNPYLAWQGIHDYLISQVGHSTILKHHYRFLTFDLWKVPDAATQMQNSYESYRDEYRHTSEEVAKSCGTTALDSLLSATNDVVEASFYVMWLHRIMNVYAIVRTTLHIMRQKDTKYLKAQMGMSLSSIVSDLSEKPRYLQGYPSFLQTYLFVWGGFIRPEFEEEEIKFLAAETSSTTEAVEHYLRITDLIFSGDGTGLQKQIYGLKAYAYVPAAVRALGIRHRRTLNASNEKSSCFGSSDKAYLAALDRSLAGSGGISKLSF